MDPPGEGTTCMANETKARPSLIVPVGTQVIVRVAVRVAGGGGVQPRGAAGEIIAAPADAAHSYRVRFPDGSEASLRREEFSLLKRLQQEDAQAAGAAPEDAGLYGYVIYRCVVGSRAYGLAHDASDTDRRGVYLPPAERHWSLFGVPEQLEDPEAQECYWELRKFLLLALKANPNVLECLYTPLVEHAAPSARELLAERSRFLSRHVFQTYNGYVLSQFKKLEQDLRTRGAIKWKHAMHLVRLLLSGVTVLREGFVPVDVGAHRERLLAIRRGETPWEEINAWRLELHREFDAAYAATRLPKSPDYEWANAFLVRARRSMV